MVRNNKVENILKNYILLKKDKNLSGRFETISNIVKYFFYIKTCLEAFCRKSFDNVENYRYNLKIFLQLGKKLKQLLGFSSRPECRNKSH